MSKWLEFGDPDEVADAWEESKRQAGFMVMPQDEYAERKERLQTEAYADGRADERAEWLPVLDALRWIRAYTSVKHTAADKVIHSRADAAIEKAGG
jgi:hypothetical protein